MSGRFRDSLGGVTSKHCRRRWDEPRGDPYDAWGASTWFFEVEPDGSVARQIEVYDHGPTLRCDLGHVKDDYGELGHGPLDAAEDWSPWAISAETFETAWSSPGG